MEDYGVKETEWKTENSIWDTYSNTPPPTLFRTLNGRNMQRGGGKRRKEAEKSRRAVSILHPDQSITVHTLSAGARYRAYP